MANIRPNSAGATRSKTPLGSYAQNPQQRTTTGTTNVYTANTTGISGQGYAANQNIPTSNIVGGKSSPMATAPAALNSSNVNNLTYNQQGAQFQTSSKNRPRSAGATRNQQNTNNSSNNPINAAYMMSSNHISAQEYVQHVQHQQQKNEPPPNPILNQVYYGGYSNTNPVNSTGVTRPLSANATSHTSIQNSQNTNNAYATPDHWSSAYKLHYGYNNNHIVSSSGNKAQSTGPVTQVVNSNISAINNPQENNIVQPKDSATSRPSSAAAIKLRDAVDLSHKFDATKIANEAVMKAVGNKLNTVGMEDEDVELKVDAENNLEALVKADEEDEMDGKPINESRSYPEVSTSTFHPSVDLANGSGLALGGCQVIVIIHCLRLR